MSTGFLFANILVVDADQAFVHVVRPVLQSAGYVVRHIASGQEALASMAARAPDLLLLATALADVDGYELVRQIKRESDLPFVPVIMFAGRENEADISAALNAGADEFLPTPVSSAELLVRVRAMLRLKQTTDALRTLNATLEQKVEARTRALEEAHARLRHTEKLSALGHLAASVAHDINNPLSGILNYLYLMKLDLPEGDAMLDDLSLVERQVHVIANLVKQLQSFSKPPRRARRPVRVMDVMEDVLALTGKDLEKRGITLVCDCDEDLPPALAAPDQLAEVLMNLILNARDAMPDGGHLRVEARADSEGLLICIADTGVGMSDEVKAHLFEPFYTTKGEQGTGLGLAICYRIVQEHGGDIVVESEEGQGTVMKVRLPIASSKEGG